MSQDSEDGAVRRTARDLRYGIDEVADGELPSELAERLAAHMLTCPECADELERLRRVKDLVRRSCIDTAPSALRERITVQCRSVEITAADGSAAVTVTETTARRD